jgi:hypothetical protein
MVLIAITVLVALPVMGLSPAMLAAFAPDFALVLAAVGTLLCLPAAWRAALWARRSLTRNRTIGHP